MSSGADPWYARKAAACQKKCKIWVPNIYISYFQTNLSFLLNPQPLPQRVDRLVCRKELVVLTFLFRLNQTSSFSSSTRLVYHLFRHDPESLSRILSIEKMT